MGWTVGGVAGGVVAIAGTVGAWIGLSSIARPQVLRHAVPLRKLLGDAEQEVEQNKDWVKIDFERKLKEFEERRANKVREAEETMARVVAEAEQKRREQHQAADVKFPPLVEQVRVRRDEQVKKAEEIYPAKIAARKAKYDADKKELDESYLKTKTGTDQEYQRVWQALIDDWTGGMGKIDDGPARRERGGRAAVPRLDAARARRLEAADGGPARTAVRRLLGRPEPVPQRRPPRPAAQVGAHPLRPARPGALPHPWPRRSSAPPTAARTTPSRCSRR